MISFFYLVGAGAIISSLSVIGVLILKFNSKVAHFVEKRIEVFSALSAGIFIVTVVLLGGEALELLPMDKAIFSFALGSFVYVLLNQIFNHHRHGHNSEGLHHHHHQHKRSAAWKVLIGDTLHNIADGLLLISSFGIGSSVGLSTSLSIALHEIPQEISEFIVLKKCGYSNKEALYRNVITSLSIFVGIAIGVLIINTQSIQGYLLGATSAFFVGTIFTDLFPIREFLKSKNKVQMFAALLLGIILMTTLSLQFGHTHDEHEDHEDHGVLTNHEDHENLEPHIQEVKDSHGH